MDRARWLAVFAGLLALAFGTIAMASPRPDRAADLRLEGQLTRADHETYLDLPFAVPAGTSRLTVVFRHDGAAERTTIDLGLRDPERFRGWSGGARDGFTISASDATPSYLPGPLPAGTWNLVLGVPNLRAGVTTRYTAEIWLDPQDAPFAGLPGAPLVTEPGWWRGDLHVHSGHSDGTCRSRRGASVPCPLFKVVEIAAARGLDFVALTEHNAASHTQGLRELQPYFDDILLIPGRELTTFLGHANLFGLTAPLEFRLGSPDAESLDVVLARAARLGAVVSINHPRMPSGEACMGCGWRGDVDPSRIEAVEVLNGGAMAAFGGRAESPLSGIAFWESLLDQGHQITAIAGSDSHDPDRPVDAPGALGRPATVIWADSLSQGDLMTGLRNGRAFIDLTHPGLAALDLEARAGAARAIMGGRLTAPAGQMITFRVTAEGAPPARLHVVEPGKVVEVLAVPSGAQAEVSFTRRSEGRPGWLRVELRDLQGALLALSNPIYLNTPAAAAP
jgi:hypothetical protein